MNVNERFDQVLNAIKGINPDEALSKQVTDLTASVSDLQSQVKTLTDENAAKDTRISELETENTSLKEGKKTAETNATKFENELKDAKATIDNPEGHIKTQIAEGVKQALVESSHKPVDEPEGDEGSGGNESAELKGRDRVAAAFSKQLSK